VSGWFVYQGDYGRTETLGVEFLANVPVQVMDEAKARRLRGNASFREVDAPARRGRPPKTVGEPDGD